MYWYNFVDDKFNANFCSAKNVEEFMTNDYKGSSEILQDIIF